MLLEKAFKIKFENKFCNSKLTPYLCTPIEKKGKEKNKKLVLKNNGSLQNSTNKLQR